MPHPRAEKDWEVQQEMNIIWVALSRSKDRLVFVGGPVPVPFSLDNEQWTEEDDKIADEIVEKLEVTEIARNVRIIEDEDFELETMEKIQARERLEEEQRCRDKMEMEEKNRVPECPF